MLSAEEQQASAAPGYVALHDVTPLKFLRMGLELEDLQYVIVIIDAPTNDANCRFQRAPEGGCQERLSK